MNKYSPETEWEFKLIWLWPQAKKNGIILWKIKHNLAFAIRFASGMLKRPQICTPHSLNYPIKERPQYHVKQASRFDKRIWNASDCKITALRNNCVKRSFLLLLLYKTSVVITQKCLGRRWRDLQTSQRHIHLFRYKHLPKGRH